MIKPTPGRIVWFTPSKDDEIPNDPGQPLAAMISYVWNDRLVNLSVLDSNAIPHPRTSVQLLQDDDVSIGGSTAQWMPFQKGQATKADTSGVSTEARNAALGRVHAADYNSIDEFIAAVHRLALYIEHGTIESSAAK